MWLQILAYISGVNHTSAVGAAAAAADNHAVNTTRVLPLFL